MTTVLVTGAGGAAGVAVIRALVEQGRHVVAADADPLGAGMHLAHEHALVAPAIEGDAFVADLAEAAKRFKVDVIVCTVGEELLVLTGREADLSGAAIWLPPHDAVVTCLDKWRFAASRASPACRSRRPRSATPTASCSPPCTSWPAPGS